MKRRRPPLPAVVAAVLVAIAIWPVICAVAGRIVWTW